MDRSAGSVCSQRQYGAATVGHFARLVHSGVMLRAADRKQCVCRVQLAMP